MNGNEDCIRNFSVVQAKGHQFFLHSGRWYDLNYIQSRPKDIIKLQRVLFHFANSMLLYGVPCLENKCVLGIIIQHYRGRKICVFKYKPKKNYSRKKGYRPLFTRILIKKIFENNID